MVTIKGLSSPAKKFELSLVQHNKSVKLECEVGGRQLTLGTLVEHDGRLCFHKTNFLPPEDFVTFDGKLADDYKP